MLAHCAGERGPPVLLVPSLINPGWVLDLDDFSAQLGKEHRAIRTGAILFRRKDAKARKGESVLGHAGFRLTHCFEIIIRCISFVPSPMHIRIESR